MDESKIQHDFSYLYVGTGTMIMFSVVIIAIVLWNNHVMRKLVNSSNTTTWAKIINNSDRIDTLEILMKNQISEILKILNNK